MITVSNDQFIANVCYYLVVIPISEVALYFTLS